MRLNSVTEIISTLSTGGLGLAKSSPMFFNSETDRKQISIEAIATAKNF
jgi:hypothetical protein